MLKINLQLFAEGGGEGSAPSTAPEGSSTTTGEEVPAFIPEKAKGSFKEFMKSDKFKAPDPKQEAPAETTPAPTHVSYADLIKSDEYKEEHKAYMDQTLAKRFKKYEGLEERSNKMKGVLDVVAQKYNLDSNSEDFIEKLTEAVNADDAYVENYAIEHDLSNEEARKQINMQRKLDMFEREKQISEEQRAKDERTNRLYMNAEKVKAVFPQFDLETELSNPKFVELCAATNEDVMSVYKLIHQDELFAMQTQAMANQLQQKVAQAVTTNASRPQENGLSGQQAAAVVSPDFKSMSREQLIAFGEKMRRSQRG